MYIYISITYERVLTPVTFYLKKIRDDRVQSDMTGQVRSWRVQIFVDRLDPQICKYFLMNLRIIIDGNSDYAVCALKKIDLFGEEEI